ncbi:bifunctional diguanylate cyclase/phosphodiesterase [Dongia rigui]|uniref:EAL domain-containing protein n=1 Tax=Dongia rigui TaxID=940149 RepID=A0ABU5E109_9PROT|nr:EAL domain-containing protein [Dongia rigui]MDY0872885.1 EAL domain-containing protein [Dongia rigui]
MSHRKRIRLIALIAAAYALGGSLWIVASDRLLANLQNDSFGSSFGTLKGLAFVGVTTALLAIALRFMPGNSEKDAAPLAPRSLWPSLVAIAALAVAVGLVAFTTYRLQIDSNKRDTLQNLQAVARLKVTGLSQWLADRRSDAESTGHDRLLQEAIHQWRRSGTEADRAVTLQALRDVKLSHGFARVNLMTGNGDLLLNTNPNEQLPLDLPEIARAANARHQTIFVDLYRDKADGAVHFGFAVPIATLDGADARGRDVILFDLHAADFIDPFLSGWPLPGKRGQLVLARRENDNVLVLNSLQDRPDSALRLIIPMAHRDAPVVQYLTRGEHQTEGVDYRGIPVLAAMLSVPRTEWILAAKIDVDAALAGVERRTIVVSISTLAGLIALIATIAYLWQSRRLQAALLVASARQATEIAEERFRATFEQAPVGIAHLAFDGRILRANAEYCRIKGQPLPALQEVGVIELSAPEDRARDLELLTSFRKGEIATYQGEHRGYRDDGTEVWFTVSISLVRDKAGQPDYLIDVITDITERKRSEKSLKRASTVFQNTQEGIVVTDAGGDILSVNPAFQAITGYSEAELIGKNMRVLQSGQHDRDFYRDMWQRIATEGSWQGEIWNRRKGGAPYPEFLTISTIKDETGQPMGYVGTFIDITGIKETESRLVHLAHHDALTGLPNRLLVMSRLEFAIQVSKRKKTSGAVMFLDLDRFKNVNDSLGHPAGDELLLAVTKRLGARLRASDTLARLGGDEFLILLQDVKNPSAVASLADAILLQFEEPFTLTGGHEVYIGTSIGISLFPEDGDQADEIVKNADAALYRAKEEGRGIYRFYTAALTDKANERLSMERRLRRALERDEFLLHYQPLIRIADRRIVGFEALARWQEPGNGLIPPGSFIPLAEETGIILPLGERVLRMACRQMKSWLDAGHDIATMAVNLSPRQFHLPDIDEIVSGILTETGLPAQYLELELTESALIEQGIGAEMRLAALRKLGVRVAIDDFGTGYSSLSYLKRFPINKLKVDQSFVRDIPSDPADMEITSAIIGLARNLRLDCIAEGVETEAQLDFLRQQDCDFAQGYLFSKPVPAADAESLLGHGIEMHAPMARSSF